MIELPENVTQDDVLRMTASLMQIVHKKLKLVPNQYGRVALMTVESEEHNAYGKMLTPGYLSLREYAVWITGVWLHKDEKEIFDAD